MEMNFKFLTILVLLFSFSTAVCSLQKATTAACAAESQPNRRNLRSDQITVLINGYYESRIPLLQSIAFTYAASPFVHTVLILWGNPSTSTKTLTKLAQNLTTGPISLIRQSSDSLNSRFLPRKSIQTGAVLICDDDVEIDASSLEFAFKIWGRNPERLVGFFVRSHDLDLSRREWIYTVHQDKYSIVLTKLMILKTEYLFEYSCGGGAAMADMRRVVDRERNCEDILMNFVVADMSNAGPIMVAAQRIRDWGDPRNEYDDGNERLRLRGGVSEVGLSNRKGEHRKRRGRCITEFHRRLGRMPLRYSYGKSVNSVGEQALCRKGRKLVPCDQNVL